MISRPLPPDLDFDSGTVDSSAIPALRDIACRLHRKSIHITLLVGWGRPSSTEHASKLMVIPTTPLSRRPWKILHASMVKSARKYSLGQGWTDALARSRHERLANEYLIEQSILQNEVAFSYEGLTVLSMDRIYTFKHKLYVLSQGSTAISEGQVVASCADLLHRAITDLDGHVFSGTFFHLIYEHLDVKDSLLKKVAAAYQTKYDQEGVIFPEPRPGQNVRKQTVRKPPPPPIILGPTGVKRIRNSVVPDSRQQRPSPVPGPKTPHTAADCDPTTQSEWNMLMDSRLRRSKNATACGLRTFLPQFVVS